ncbi:response regulator transcription factor [Rhodococcus sp. NPDC059968]|uniref:response regulator transcription factor n=1 Tax=Rhodococcus sp. NPDC059968 TaxID=3347017 RepID=UPI0036717D2A
MVSTLIARSPDGNRDWQRCLVLLDEAIELVRARVAQTDSEWLARVTGLSPRELEVAQALGTGLSNRNIAEELFISENTVRFHVRSILRKLRVKNRSAAAATVAHWSATTDTSTREG